MTIERWGCHSCRNLLFLFLACLLLNCSKQDIIDQPSKNLAEWLAKAVEDREPLESLDFAKTPLSKSEAIDAQQLISEDVKANEFLKKV